MKTLVRLVKRPSRDGCSFTYYLDYVDESGKRARFSLGHSNKPKAERQREHKEKELRMGYIDVVSMRLSLFLQDSVKRTRGQVRESTSMETCKAMKDFIACVGDIDFRDVQHSHGEQFVQYCLDKGNSPATTAKKLRHLKRLFQLGRERRQLDDNPLCFVKQPKVAKRRVNIFNDDQCSRLIKGARQFQDTYPSVEWDIFIRTALCTAMRRGELLNLIWQDIDFERKTVEVSPKDNGCNTWEWHIKDTDRRTLPLTDDLITLLANLQTSQPEGCSYVFVPPHRYNLIQQLRLEGKWSVEKGRCPLNNFTRQFKKIMSFAGIKSGEFHDVRRTCLSKWLSSGLSEFDVMNLAGHSKFETTRRFYLAVSSDLVERARAVSVSTSLPVSVTHLSHTPIPDCLG